MSELVGELTDALEILYSCRRLNVPINDGFLDHIGELISQMEAEKGCSALAKYERWPDPLFAEA